MYYRIMYMVFSTPAFRREKNGLLHINAPLFVLPTIVDRNILR